MTAGQENSKDFIKTMELLYGSAGISFMTNRKNLLKEP
jgi:hypothetical protein